MLVSPPIRTLKDTFTGRLIAGLLFLGMLAFAYVDYSDSHTFDPWLWGFTTFFGVILAFAVYWAAIRRVNIHQEGISYVSPFKNAEMRWEEVQQTRYSQTPVNVGAHFGLLGLLVMAVAKKGTAANKGLVIEGPAKIKLTSNMKDVDEAIRLVLDAVNPRVLKQAEANLSSGMPVEFGPLSLTVQGVVWKKKDPIAYTSIVKCVIDGANFQLKSEGKWLNNVSVAANKIPNIFVVIQMIEARRATVGAAPVSKGMSAGFGS
jgi:hypothetical protein